MDNKLYKIILVSLLGVVIVLLCISCYLLGIAHGRSEITSITEAVDEDEIGGTKRRAIVNRENADTVAAAMDMNSQRSGPQNYEVIMNTDWIFGEGGTQSDNAYVENSRENRNTVRFALALEEQPDNVIYISPEIPVGKSLRSIRLSHPVPEGRSKAIVTYWLLDESGRTTGEVKAGVTLIYE